LRPFGGIFDVAARQERINELNEIANDPEFWTDQSRSQPMLKEKAALERVVNMWLKLRESLDDAQAMHELGEEANDEETLDESVQMFQALAVLVRKAEVQQMLGEEADPLDAILEVNSGAGGTDASDFAAMLLRMYRQFADRMGYSFNVLDTQAHDEAGIKSAQIEVSGPYAYGYLKAEIGVHRLVRISPFDASARRHTAFASVDVTPSLDDDIEVKVSESDCRIDTYRASGAGGQHVNTTDSAVRITHLETGIVVTCQAERSQHKNRARAWKMLRAKLYQHEQERRQSELDAVNADKKRIEWGSQIRNYVLHPYRLVKDLRTGHETGNTDRVLDGDLLPFMETWLAQRTGHNQKQG
jgi:peptide chain release factor 2